MQRIVRPIITALGVAALATTLMLTAIGPRTVKAADSHGGPRPYTTQVSCSTWTDLICFANITPIPAGKRFVVDYVTVRAFTDKASDQKLLVTMTFQSGSSTTPTAWVINPVLHFQAAFSDANLYHASEKVLAFAEKVSPKTSGQLYVNRYPGGGAYTASVTLTASGYLEDMD